MDQYDLLKGKLQNLQTNIRLIYFSLMLAMPVILICYQSTKNGFFARLECIGQ